MWGGKWHAKQGDPAGAKPRRPASNARGGPVLTSSLAGIGKDNDVIKRPSVVGMRWVEGQLGCFLSLQGHQEGRVDHRDLEAALALAVLGREVLSCAAIVALKKGRFGAEAQAQRALKPQALCSWSPPSLTCGVIPHQKLE